MIFDFYRASECLNIIDSYNDSYEVDAYRMYKRGDEHLHKAEKELFYDRHNRGFLDKRKQYRRFSMRRILSGELSSSIKIHHGR